MSIFERLGQGQGIRTAVDDFCGRVVGDLAATPSSFGVSAEDIGADGEALTAHRDEIVAAPAPA